MDVIGDFITVVRNSSKARKDICSVRWSRLRAGIAKVLKDCGYIKDFQKLTSSAGDLELVVSLKYVNGVPAVTEIGRISTPGCRSYSAKTEIPTILGGMGECIVSTSKGILSGKDAKKMGVGGELMCYVF